MQLIFNKLFKKGFLLTSTFVARLLPLWKKEKILHVEAPIISLPVSLPAIIIKLREEFAKQFIKAKVIPPRRVFLLKDVYVSGKAVIFKNLRIFIPSLTWLKDLNLYRRGNFLLKQLTSVLIEIPETEIVALVYDDWSASNYYHWMIESLPRMIIIKKNYPDCLLLVPEPSPDFIPTTIKLIGFSNTLSLRKNDVLRIANLIFPELIYYYEEKEYFDLFKNVNNSNIFRGKLLQTQVNSSFNGNEELILLVRQMLLKHFNKPAIINRRIFISRSRQKTRRLINESKVVPMLSKYGFEIIYFEDLNFNQQVELMLETAILVGVHGANMVNILFMQPGAKIIEIMNKDHLNDAYYLLASIVGIPYYCVPGIMADKTIKNTDDSVLLNDAHLLVDLTELKETILMALEKHV